MFEYSEKLTTFDNLTPCGLCLAMFSMLSGCKHILNSHRMDFFRSKNYSNKEKIVMLDYKNTAINRSSRFALTICGDYTVSTIQKKSNRFETIILSSKIEDEFALDHYIKYSSSEKSALDEHTEAVFHIKILTREGLWD